MLNPAEIGTGNYYVRMFTRLNDGENIYTIVRDEEVVDTTAATTPKMVSVTLALEVTVPGGDIFVTNPNWEGVTNVGATASLALKKHNPTDASQPIDMGYIGTAGAPQEYRVHVNVLSAAGTGVDNEFKTGSFILPLPSLSFPVHIFPTFDEWSDDVRWKYIIAHEMGHQVEGNRNEVRNMGGQH